jgi:hypothetical protein
LSIYNEQSTFVYNLLVSKDIQLFSSPDLSITRTLIEYHHIKQNLYETQIQSTHQIIWWQKFDSWLSIFIQIIWPSRQMFVQEIETNLAEVHEKGNQVKAEFGLVERACGRNHLCIIIIVAARFRPFLDHRFFVLSTWRFILKKYFHVFLIRRYTLYINKIDKPCRIEKLNGDYFFLIHHPG